MSASRGTRIDLSELRGGALWLSFSYSLERYPFPALVYKAIEDQPHRNLDNHRASQALSLLREAEPSVQPWTREDDQGSRWHHRFYASFVQWRSYYHDFVLNEVAPLFDQPIYYQAIPTFRVHLPLNVAVGEYHTDQQYNHPVGEIAFWVPLTQAWDTNSIQVRDENGLHSFTAAPGDVMGFDAISRFHGNEINRTGSTRVSFDFRCIPVGILEETEARSVNSGLRFIAGEYYDPSPAITTTPRQLSRRNTGTA